jgi:FkbH-like protein
MTKAVLSTSEPPHALREASLAVLMEANSTLMRLTQTVTELESQMNTRTLKIGVSSSVTVDLLNIYLRKYGVINNVKLEVVSGNYDDPIGDVDLFSKAEVDHIVLMPFFDNVLPSFESQLQNLDPSILDAKEEEIRERYRVVFDRARGFSAIFLCTFHRMGGAAALNGIDVGNSVLIRFNAALREEAAAYGNVHILDSEEIMQVVGRDAAFDNRFYYRSKAPYSGIYMNELAHRISASTRGFGSYFYKVLALDCDNTLWGGVIGEDLLDGIKLGPYDYPGNIFWRMQQEFSSLERQGVLLVLVTKNNPVDIDEVMKNHQYMVLNNSQIVAKKVNWNDKASNLRALAEELNVGLDSFVYLDDSAFECESIRQQLPMVKTFQVPSVLSEYPRVVAEIKTLFLAGGISEESKSKTEQYRQRADAEELRRKFGSQEDYLASLQLKVEVTRNANASASRISELSQKSNQFNLTTHRYSVSEVSQMMEDENCAVYSLVVSDKFGSAGLTGVVVIRYDEAVAFVENFFMSCRVIGRGIETAIWACIVSDALKRSCIEFCAKYVPSAKNEQVADFFDRLGIPLISQSVSGERIYKIPLPEFPSSLKPWIEIVYVE